MDNRASHYNFYIYSQTIARIDDESNTEIKNHKTQQWTKVEDGEFYRRIQESGELVSQEEAENFYSDRRRHLSGFQGNSNPPHEKNHK